MVAKGVRHKESGLEGCIKTLLVIVLALCLAQMLHVLQTELVAASGYTVSGRVYYSTTPLNDVTVELVQGEVTNSPLQSTTTTNGYYNVLSVPPGSYWIKTYGPTAEYIGWCAFHIEVVSSDVIRDIYLPKKITLLSPSGTASLHPTLSWGANSEASRYVIQINVTENWQSIEAGNSTSNSYVVQAELTPGVNYTWQADAYDVQNHQVGSTESVFSFTARVPPPPSETPSTFTSLSEGLADTPWPKFRHDARNTGLSPYVGAQDNTLKWTYRTGSGIETTPAIGSDGTIYFGSCDYNLYALNPDGTMRWAYTTEGWVESSPAIGSDGTIYFGSYDNKFYALNPDGTLKWSYTTNKWHESSPAIGPDGTIYVGSANREELPCVPGVTGPLEHDAKLFAFNPDGTLKWTYPTGWNIHSSPAIALDGTIYFGTMDYPKFYTLNPDGTLKWSYTLPNGSYASPAIGSDGTIYLTSCDYELHGKLYALNSNGTLKWTYTMGDFSNSSPAIGPDGTIYIGSDKLYAVNPNGTLKWSYPLLGGSFYSSPAVGSDGTIYIGSYILVRFAPDGTVYIESIDKTMYAINPDGTLKWSYTLGDVTVSSPAIGPDGTVYIGSMDDKLYAFGEAAKNRPPVANASASRYEVSSGDVVLFDSYGSYDPDPDGTIVSYYWDFGDNENATGEKVTHRFRGQRYAPKTYDVSLIVKDDKGAVAEKAIQIVVKGLKRVVKVRHIPGTPMEADAYARVTVWYYWVDVIDGENVYMVTDMSAEADGFVGYYTVFLLDAHSRPKPLVIWWDLRSSLQMEGWYYYPFDTGVNPFFSRVFSNWEPRSPEVRSYGDEEFQGFVVRGSDAVQIRATGVPEQFEFDTDPGIVALKVLATLFFEENTAYFQPDSAETRHIPIDMNDFNLVAFCSPGELRVYDSLGNVTGLVNGEVKQEIPDSGYDNGIVIILNPSDSYYYEVAGTDEGSYGLTVVSVENGETSTLNLTNVPTSASVVHQYTIDWDVLSGGEKGVTMQIDSNGDGIFEKTVNLPTMDEITPTVRIIMPELVIVETPEDLPEFVRIAEKVEIRLMNVVPETPLELRIENSKISRVWIDLKENHQNVVTKIEKLEVKPPELPDPPGVVWTYHRIEVNVPEDAIENAEIDFWVLKEWLATHGVSKENIVLLRFHEGGWEELPTEILGENATHISYKASTGGFSVFAITAYAPPAEAPPAGIDIMPIAALVVAIIVIIAFVVLMKRRREPIPRPPTRA